MLYICLLLRAPPYLLLAACSSVLAPHLLKQPWPLITIFFQPPSCLTSTCCFVRISGAYLQPVHLFHITGFIPTSNFQVHSWDCALVGSPQALYWLEDLREGELKVGPSSDWWWDNQLLLGWYAYALPQIIYPCFSWRPKTLAQTEGFALELLHSMDVRLRFFTFRGPSALIFSNKTFCLDYVSAYSLQS